MPAILVDSHAHLDMEEFDTDREDVIERARQDGVVAILCPADLTNQKSMQIVFDLIKKSKNIIASSGVHPHQAKLFIPDHCQTIEELAREGKIKAVGEIGLDFYYTHSPPQQQESAFRHQLAAAQNAGLPVIVHSRNSDMRTAQVVEEEHFTEGGVLHCFTEDWELAKRMLDRNFYISFSGILTFPNAGQLREAAKKIPLDRIMVETDSPYLVPSPFRGRIKRNEPAFVKETAKVLAELKKVTLAELAEITTHNFETLFKFEIKKM
ncbi:MAG: TatD family hydrolase [Candidatus Aminicenantaceae bacterium]